MQESEGRFVSTGNHAYTDYHTDMSDSSGLIEYPYSRFHPRYPNSRKNGLQRGEDPKDRWVEYCKPSCHGEKEAMKRCEQALRVVRTAEPDKSCIFRYRQWVECIEGCAQPKVFYHLKGPSRRGPMDWFKPGGPTGLH